MIAFRSFVIRAALACALSGFGFGLMLSHGRGATW